MNTANSTISSSNVTFFLYDHLGNTRVSYKSGNSTTPADIQYAGDYFPYGKILREFANGAIEKYLTTDHERDQETGLDYRGARYYDSDIARFLSVDPLAAKYVSWSTYNYVAGNPIIYIDTKGKEIIIVDPKTKAEIRYIPNSVAPNNADDFVKKTFEALDYLYNEGVQNGVNRVAFLSGNKDIRLPIIYSSNAANGNQFDPGVNELKFNPYYAFKLQNGVQSPIIGMAHEIDHAYMYNYLYALYLNTDDDKKADNLWARIESEFNNPVNPATNRLTDGGLKEENRAVQYENFIAKKLTQGTRLNYSINPLSIFWVSSIFMTTEETIMQLEPKSIKGLNLQTDQKREIIKN